MLQTRTSSLEETRRLAAELEPLLVAGDVLLLSGDLGAGKTAFVQGLAVAMGITDPVTSPTFTLLHTYQGRRLRLHHLDAYRLENAAEALDLGLPELVDDEAVVAVEWGERIVSELPQDFLRIRIYLGDGEEARRFDLELAGPSWQARAAALTTAIAAIGTRPEEA